MADAPAAAGAVLGPVRQGSAAFRLLHRFADALQNADQPEEEANAEDQMWNRVLQLQQEVGDIGSFATSSASFNL